MSQQALYWELLGFRREPERLTTNRRVMVKKHVHCISIKKFILFYFYFFDNFPSCKPIQIIFGRNIAEKFGTN